MRKGAAPFETSPERDEGDAMKFLSAIAIALVALAFAPLAFAPLEATDTPGCVTRSEYRAVYEDDSISRVHRIFDTDGRKIGGAKRRRIHLPSPELSDVPSALVRRDPVRPESRNDLEAHGEVRRLGRLIQRRGARPAVAAVSVI